MFATIPTAGQIWFNIRGDQYVQVIKLERHRHRLIAKCVKFDDQYRPLPEDVNPFHHYPVGLMRGKNFRLVG